MTTAAHLELGPPMTLEEWAALEDEPGEIVDQRLVEEEMPTVLHEAIVGWLIGLFRAWLVPDRGWVLGSEAKYAVAPKRGRKPDLSVYLAGTAPARRQALLRTPPFLMVEVLSPDRRDRRRDRIDKLAEYAAFGVRYYWILDPEDRVLDVYELGASGRYSVMLAASEGAHAVPGCDGLSVDLDALWRYADALPEDETEA